MKTNIVDRNISKYIFVNTFFMPPLLISLENITQIYNSETNILLFRKIYMS